MWRMMKAKEVVIAAQDADDDEEEKVMWVYRCMGVGGMAMKDPGHWPLTVVDKRQPAVWKVESVSCW